MGRVSGPLLDRIDLCVEIQPVDAVSLRKTEHATGESSASIRKRVMSARSMQEERFQDSSYHFNADVEAVDMDKFCALGAAEQKCMEQLYESLRLSVRAYHRIRRVARTIADLAGEKEIQKEHLMEAACFRPAREYWR